MSTHVCYVDRTRSVGLVPTGVKPLTWLEPRRFAGLTDEGAAGSRRRDLQLGAQWRTVIGDRSMRHHMRSVETAARSAREKSTQRRACALARHTAPWRCAVRTSTAPSRVPSRSTVRHTPCAVRRAPRAARWVPCSVPYRGAPRRPAGCRAPCACSPRFALRPPQPRLLCEGRLAALYC